MGHDSSVLSALRGSFLGAHSSPTAHAVGSILAPLRGFARSSFEGLRTELLLPKNVERRDDFF
jgi:hypothetical protein